MGRPSTAMIKSPPGSNSPNSSTPPARKPAAAAGAPGETSVTYAPVTCGKPSARWLVRSRAAMRMPI